MEQQPDFKKAYLLANEMLIASRYIKSFPFNVDKFIQNETDLTLCSYKKAYEKIGLDCYALGSHSALFAKLGGKNILFFNQDDTLARDSFNKLHETGHFLLVHNESDSDVDVSYSNMEVETNWFAAQMLMPLQILQEVQKRFYKIDEEFLMKYFGVSESAAKLRLKTMRGRLFLTQEEKMFDDIILQKFSAFIDQIAPKKLDYSYSCWDDPIQKERDTWQ